MESKELDILRRLEAGEIDVGEAAGLLAAISDGQATAQEEPEAVGSQALPPAGAGWRRYWTYPLLAGGAILILGALIMGLVYATAAARGWLVCGWLPMILGFLLMLLGLWSQRARWLHLRISQDGRRKIAFSLPLPLGLAAWVLRLVQPFVPQLRETGVDDLIIALRDSATQDAPVYVQVQDKDDEEHIEIYIG
jgi:hypothetical protein